MLHCFRVANELDRRRHDGMFIHRSEIVSARLSSDDTLVLVDDFSGTGTQACSSWKLFQELLGGEPRVFLVLVGVARNALGRIRAETDLLTAFGFELTEADDVFHEECPHFSRRDKEAILGYCRRVQPGNPRGYGGCGYLIVFAHRCPNNTVPILHATNANWEGLFRRNR
jgi:hypothetical protein